MSNLEELIFNAGKKSRPLTIENPYLKRQTTDNPFQKQLVDAQIEKQKFQKESLVVTWRSEHLPRIWCSLYREITS